MLEGGGPGVIRTPDRRITNPLLYPAEIRGHRGKWASALASGYGVVSTFPDAPTLVTLGGSGSVAGYDDVISIADPPIRTR
jgi:hypothetical protein